MYIGVDNNATATEELPGEDANDSAEDDEPVKPEHATPYFKQMFYMSWASLVIEQILII